MACPACINFSHSGCEEVGCDCECRIDEETIEFNREQEKTLEDDY